MRWHWLVLATTALLFLVVGIAVLTPRYVAARHADECMRHVRSLMSVLNMYCEDYDGYMPLPPHKEDPSDRWTLCWGDVLQPYIAVTYASANGSDNPYEREVYYCPLDRTQRWLGSYVMPRYIFGKRLADLKKQHKVVFYEDQPRHDGKRTVGFADGTVKLMEYEPEGQ